jgi:gas vesicle protein
MTSFGKFLGGAVLGGAIGAVIGMLLAPRSGAETRALIREEFESRCHDSTEAIQAKAEIIQEKASAFREKVSELAEDLEEKGQQAFSRLRGGDGGRSEPSA